MPVQQEASQWGTIVVQAPSPGTLFMPVQCFHNAQESADTSFIDAREHLDKKVGRIDD